MVYLPFIQWNPSKKRLNIWIYSETMLFIFVRDVIAMMCHRLSHEISRGESFCHNSFQHNNSELLYKLRTYYNALKLNFNINENDWTKYG